MSMNNEIPNISASSSYTVEANKNQLSEEEAIKKMNIPPRDEEAYPMPNNEDIEKAGSFLWKMSLLASSYDKNMQALIWSLYISMNNFILTENDDSEKAFGLETLVILNRLKLYIKDSNNPIFKDNLK